MTFELIGPTKLPSSGLAPESLVVFFHGYGASGEGFFEVANSWAKDFSQTAFVMPTAPHPWPYSSRGFQWFDLKRDDQGNIDRSAEGVAHRTQEMAHMAPNFVQALEILARSHNVSLKQTILAGFSQGAMLALYMGLYCCDIGAVMSYSGILCPTIEERPLYNPPILLVHGDQDDVVPYSFLHDAQTKIESWKMPVEVITCLGLAHSMNRFGIDKGKDFLQKVLPSLHSAV